MCRRTTLVTLLKQKLLLKYRIITVKIMIVFATFFLKTEAIKLKQDPVSALQLLLRRRLPKNPFLHLVSTYFIIIIHHFWCIVNTSFVVCDKIFNTGGAEMKTYVDRIRELREDNDLKQQQIAELLGTTQQVYSRYEQGINEIPLRHIITLSRFYNVSCDYILGESNNKDKK